MVLDGLKWFEAKIQKSMTINDKSAGGYLVLTQLGKSPAVLYLSSDNIKKS